jgi:hypothetical protein
MTSLLPQGPVIITRYKGPTNHRGSRIVAVHKRDTGLNYRVTLSWDYNLSPEENHRVAADAILKVWKFASLVIVARGHDADGYYWICTYQAQGS